MSRTRANLFITGTPGVGKTTFASMVAQRYKMLHVPVSQLIAEKHLYVERDEERDCTIYDEQMLDDAIDEIINSHPEGGVIFDFHCSDIVPIEQVDYVIVLQCTSDILWKRLESRGYAEAKIRENTEAEIFRTILDEVIEDFPESMIKTFQSETLTDLENALDQLQDLIELNQ